MNEQIDTVELRFLKKEDYYELRNAMEESYLTMQGSVWKEEQIEKLINLFPQGQVAITVNGDIVGAALAIIVNYDDIEEEHDYREITGNYSFSTHDPEGDVMYGIDVFIHPNFRGMRFGRRLYDFRKELCEQHNLKGIIFGGRIPNYHKYADELTPKEYIQKVKTKEIHDPVLNFQLSNDFHVKKVLKDYLPGDTASYDYAVLLQWDNIYYEKPRKKPRLTKSVVRIGLVQWQMRRYGGMEDLFEQVEYFVDSVAGYRCDFALFPEYFNAPLMAKYNALSEVEAIRSLAGYTEETRERFVQLAIQYNINIITGSLPFIDEDDRLYNIGFLCKRNGDYERYTKLHITPDEALVWGLKGGTKLKAFDTDCGKIGILICYDVEFPELSRILADQGMQILFVPFLTDTQNGYARVRHCAQARAIENECYVAVTGSVGNLPKVHNMDIQFAHSCVLTPCDFAFPTNGVKAETTPNTEMILIADVNLDLLKELNKFGSVRTLHDRRKDLYSLRWKG